MCKNIETCGKSVEIQFLMRQPYLPAKLTSVAADLDGLAQRVQRGELDAGVTLGCLHRQAAHMRSEAAQRTTAPATWAWLEALDVLEAASLPGTAMTEVNPADDPDYNPNHPAKPPWVDVSWFGMLRGQSAIIEAWGGGAYHPTRHELYVHGGGHADGAENSVYRLRLDMDAPVIELYTAPSTDVSTPEGATDGAYPDGLPASVHTYHLLGVHPPTDRLIHTGGAVRFPSRGDGFGVIWRLALDATMPDKYQRALASWSKGSADFQPYLAQGGHGSIVYCPENGRMYMTDSGSFPVMSSYDPVGDNIRTEWAFSRAVGRYLVSDMIPGYWVAVTFISGFLVVDLATKTEYTPLVTGAGAAFLNSTAPLCYDGNGHLWSWRAGNTLLRLTIPDNPATDTWQCDLVTMTGSQWPAAGQANGTYGRMRFGEHNGKGFLVLINEVDRDADVVRVY